MKEAIDKDPKKRGNLEKVAIIAKNNIRLTNHKNQCSSVSIHRNLKDKN